MKDKSFAVQIAEEIVNNKLSHIKCESKTVSASEKSGAAYINIVKKFDTSQGYNNPVEQITIRFASHNSSWQDGDIWIEHNCLEATKIPHASELGEFASDRQKQIHQNPGKIKDDMFKAVIEKAVEIINANYNDLIRDGNGDLKGIANYHIKLG